MKLALLGAANSGKSVYFSALYHMFRNVVAVPTLTPSRRKEYEQLKINTQVGFRLCVNNTMLDGELAANARLLAKRPMKWPEKTDQLKQATISVQFDFVPLDGGKSRSYERDIELYDPAGGAFTKEHRESEVILEKLCECNAGIAFFPADVILEAVDSDDPEEIDDSLLADIKGQFAVGEVMKAMMKMNGALDKDDIFPVCFVITKGDLIPDNKIPVLNAIIYNHIIAPFSRENKRLMVCICPISVVNKETNNFRSTNLEWPLLFAAQGAIMRDANFWKRIAENERETAKITEARAAQIDGWNWFDQAWHQLIEWETAASLRRKAASDYSGAKWSLKYAQDKEALANDILASISAEKAQRGIRVLMAGREVDPKTGAR